MISFKEKKEECGLIGIVSHLQAAPLSAMGMFALQHRGEEAAGVAGSNGETIKLKAGLGHVNKIFETPDDFAIFKDSSMAIGHTRYSVTGSSVMKNVQPLLVDNSSKGSFVLAHNGNLTNAYQIRQELKHQGAIFQTTMDTEILLHLIVKSKEKDFRLSVINAINQVEGAFCLLIMHENKLYAVRDSYGFRPLCWGIISYQTSNNTKKVNQVPTYVVASETCALDLIGAKYMGQIHPGEMLEFQLNHQSYTKNYVFQKKEAKEKKCIFEMMYFSRPDSLTFGESVYQFRKELGKQLAIESPVDVDYVIPIPDSGNYAALGYAQELNIPFELAITKNHYVGRSFIQPTQELRDLFVKMKLNPIKNIIHDKKVVLVDDTIVRGTTTKRKIQTLKDCGVKEVHMRVAAPPIKHPCYYGVDFPSKTELIANRYSLKDIEEYLGLDSLAYLSNEGLFKASKQNGFCDACFSGIYPTQINNKISVKEILEIS